MGTNLAEFDTVSACDAGVIVPLLHPRTGKPTGAAIEVYGKDSTVFREYIREAINEQRRREAAASRKRGGTPQIRTAEDDERDGINMLVACTKGWTGLDDEDGQPLPFTVPNCRKVYTNYPRIRAQVDAAIEDWESFLPENSDG